MNYEAGYINDESYPLPVAQGPTLRHCIDIYGKQPQVDIAIEEMSELTKALLKERRALRQVDPAARNQAIMNIADEMADVIIMLTQLTILFENRADVQEIINRKLMRQEERLKEAAIRTTETAAQKCIAPAT